MYPIVLLSIFGILNLFIGFLRSNKLLLPGVLLVLLAALGLNVWDWNAPPHTFFNHMLAGNHYTVVFTGIVVLTTLLLLPFSRSYETAREPNLAEYYSLLLFALVGATMMIGYDHLLMLFVGIEILSICMYVLAGANKRDARSNEAALKYFLMGAFATGILLFGVALLYGATGTFALRALPAAVANPANASLLPMLYVGILMMIIGIGFKVSAAPFHFWTPDVYEGTPLFFTAFMSTVVKTAGFAAFLKLLAMALPSQQGFWLPTVQAMCALTLLLGNVGAAAQGDAKRMLAYSSVSHAGYLLIALVASYEGALVGPVANALFFYSLAYSLATVAAFGVLKLVADHRRGRTDYAVLNGLGRTNPLLAFSMTVAMLSLAGIPLTAGFWGKFMVLAAAVGQGHIGLVVFAVVMSLVGIYYYLRPIMAMYLRPAEDGATAVPVDGLQTAALVLLALLSIALGVVPGVLSGVL